MPGFLSVLLMLAVAYSFWREGIFTVFCMTINVFLAGLVTFNYFEPLAGFLEPFFRGTMDGYKDALSMVLLFAGTLAALRTTTNYLVNNELTYHPLLYQFGAGFFGLLTGYFLAGFFFCMLQTLPWHENFMSFDPRAEGGDASGKMRSIFPPDRVWLAMMSRASRGPFSTSPVETFDKEGSFEARYARYRHYNDSRDPLPYSSELDPPPEPTPPPSTP